MIPPIERILAVDFSYANLLLIFNPVVITTKEEMTETLEVLDILDRKGLTKKITKTEQKYKELLELLVEHSVYKIEVENKEIS